MENIETINYKGYDIEIKQDENYESPNEWEDEELFLVGYHRDFSVERNDIITKNEAVAIFTGKIDELEDYEKDKVKEIKKKYHTFGLEAYIHSGVSLALSYEGNFCDRQWDVSQLGLVLVGKKLAKDRKKARKLAEGLIENWNKCLSGQVYGYIVEDKETGDQIGSCWGFYGDEGIEQIKNEAKSEIDNYIKNEKKQKHAEYKRKELERILNEIKNYGFKKKVAKALK